MSRFDLFGKLFDDWLFCRTNLLIGFDLFGKLFDDVLACIL